MSVYITALKKPEASSRHVNELASTSSPYANGANGVTKATTSVAVKGKGAKGSSSSSMIRVDIQRELRLNGCAIEETKRMAKRREQHIKDLIARIEASHEQKKKRNIGLSNLQNKQTAVRTSLFEFPEGEASSSGSQFLASSSSQNVDYSVYTTRTVLRTSQHTLVLPKKPSSKYFQR